jgi:hypothetical protein
MIEPVFAHLLRADRHLHSRGDAAHTETLAMITAYNAKKYLRKPPQHTLDNQTNQNQEEVSMATALSHTVAA